MTAADARSHLVQLEAERTLVHADGVMTGLEDEIDKWRRRYIAAALNEFTKLRGAAPPRARLRVIL
jgi:hypothetical protein